MVGKPAIVVRTTDNYIDKNKGEMVVVTNYGNGWAVEMISNRQKEKMEKGLANGTGYIVCKGLWY